MKFTVHDRSLDKANWMLQNGALDSLKDILQSLIQKRHKIAGKLFRDILETLNIAAYFHSASNEAKKNLSKWFDDEILVYGCSKVRCHVLTQCRLTVTWLLPSAVVVFKYVSDNSQQ